MPLIAFLDETGDHSLAKIDVGFPVFVLIFYIIDLDEYVGQVVPSVVRLKIEQFGHEGVIIHSRDIRKAQGDFGFLTEPAKRKPFYDRINQIMSSATYTLVGVAIDKQKLEEQYAYPSNPYGLALTFALERLVYIVNMYPKQASLNIVAESRGKNEDNELKATFSDVISKGTKFIKVEEFKKLGLNLVFQPKNVNIIGNQMADLAAYPTARYVMNPSADNPAFEVIEPKFHKTSYRIHGLKIFPGSET